MSIESNAQTINIQDRNRSSLVETAHIERISKIVRSHKDLRNLEAVNDDVNPGNSSNNYHHIHAESAAVPIRGEANYIVPESIESAQAQLRELPPIRMPTVAIKKKKMLGTPSLQIFSRTSATEEKLPVRSNTANEGKIKADITKMDPKDIALGLYNSTLAGYGRDDVFPLLGKLDPFNNAILIEYCNLNDFRNITLDCCLRRLCDQVELKGETQIIDRVLYQISRRYWDCNPEMLPIYRSIGIINLCRYCLRMLILYSTFEYRSSRCQHRAERNQKNAIKSIRQKYHGPVDHYARPNTTTRQTSYSV